MTDYRFETTWRLQAGRQEAWDLLYDGEGWPTWWPSVRQVDVLEPGGPDRVGRLLRYHFATKLPYTLTFEARIVQVSEPTHLVATAEGELAGQWTCDMTQDGPDVAVRHVWAVSTTKPWMNALAPLARPVFSWNHAALMREGGEGFARRLGTTVSVEPGESRRPVAQALIPAVGAAIGAAVLVVRAVRRRRPRS